MTRPPRYDVVVCIPSLDEAGNIGRVVRALDAGLGGGALLVNCDNDSADGTRDAFLRTPTRADKRYVSTPPGVKGKGHNVMNGLRAAVEADARVVAFVDADVESAAAGWVERLTGPVLSGDAGYVFPRYRTSAGGPLTRLLCYPLVHGYFGADVRQPIGGEIALSPDLAARLLDEGGGRDDVRGYGVDVWITTEAIVGGARCREADLGRKVHRPRPWPTIGPIVEEVLTTLFTQCRRHAAAAAAVTSVAAVPAAPDASDEPVEQRAAPETEGLLVAARSGYASYRGVLPAPLREAWDRIMQDETMDVSAPLWAQTVYAFVVAFAAGRAGVAPLLPLFFRRLVSFAAASPVERERQSEDVAKQMWAGRGDALAQVAQAVTSAGGSR